MDNLMDNLQHFLNGAVSGSVGVILSHPIDTIKSNVQDNKRVNLSLRSLYRGVVPAVTGVGFEKALVFGTYENSKKILDKYNSNERINIVISGLISGLSASIIVTPVERIKILRQTGANLSLQHFRPVALYQGLSATFTREVPGFGIYFSVYNHLKKSHMDLDQTKEFLPISAAFVYGGISGATAWAGIYPQDVIKTRMQAQVSQDKIRFTQTVSQIYRDAGLRGFFRGFHLALFRAVPLHAGTFATMEVMRRWSGIDSKSDLD
jgi:solute carrier family 25 carnitine/acylcarnitine transporter 20/29